MKKSVITVAFLMLTPWMAFAGWQGPQNIVSLSFGNEELQLAIEQEDEPYVKFSTLFSIDSSGYVVIADSINRKVLVYSNSGNHVGTIRPKVQLAENTVWPNAMFSIPGGRVVISSGDDTQLYNYEGDLQANISVGADSTLLFATYDGYLFFKKDSSYHKYSPTGQKLQSYSAKPLELGVIKEEKKVATGYQFGIAYPSMIYSFVIPTDMLRSYYLDLSNRLNVAARTQDAESAFKISQCGKLIGNTQLPKSVRGQEEITGIERFSTYLEQYGRPVFGADNNLYTWKRTPDNYSILKWTWVDDPNVPIGPDAPSGLGVAASINGLYLTWAASPNDPGCVTGYEIAMATSAGGVFSTVATVEKGVVKHSDTTAKAGTMYYYKVRAKAGSEFSPYTAEVSGKR